MQTGGRFRRRILLVDSNEAILLGCSDALLAQGYEVIKARNGFEALRGASADFGALRRALRLVYSDAALYNFLEHDVLLRQSSKKARRLI